MEAIKTRIRARLRLAQENSSAAYSAASVNSPVLFKLSYSARYTACIREDLGKK